MQAQDESLRDATESVLRAALGADLRYAGAYRAWREAILADDKLHRARCKGPPMDRGGGFAPCSCNCSGCRMPGASSI
jgi:hypothetical protein